MFHVSYRRKSVLSPSSVCDTVTKMPLVFHGSWLAIRLETPGQIFSLGLSRFTCGKQIFQLRSIGKTRETVDKTRRKLARSRYREVVAEQSRSRDLVDFGSIRFGPVASSGQVIAVRLKDANIDCRRWRTPGEDGSSGLALGSPAISLSWNSWPRHQFSFAQQWSSKLP